MTDRYYAGIGSRETPDSVLKKMEELGARLANMGFVLRSGGASGADSAFERGCDSVEGLKEIYLPWKNFNNSGSQFYTVSESALEIAKKVHPKWKNLSRAGQLLHGRNVYQVLGYKLNSPSSFVVCWTKGGEMVGGTATAMRLARSKFIPVFKIGDVYPNLNDEEELEKYLDHLNPSVRKSVGEFLGDKDG